MTTKANRIDYEDPATRAVHQRQYTVMETLPYPVKVALWNGVAGYDVEHSAMNVILCVEEYDMTIEQAGEQAARLLEATDRDQIVEMHWKERRQGRRGSAHVLARATPLRDADTMPRLGRRRRLIR